MMFESSDDTFMKHFGCRVCNPVGSYLPCSDSWSSENKIRHHRMAYRHTTCVQNIYV